MPYMQARLPLLVLVVLAVAISGCVAPSGKGGSDGGDGGDGGLPPATNGTIAWGDAASAFIRPGAQLGTYCTLNFLFTDGNGTAYIGTAAHCTESIGERVNVGGGEEFGTVVYDSDVTSGADGAVDFTLIQIDTDQVKNANPTVLGYDAPKGTIEAGEAQPTDQVAVYGYGMVLGQNEETRPRFGVLVDEDGKLYRADMPAVNGDSGAPLIHVPSGKAFGIISHYGIGALPPATDEGPILPFILNELAAADLHVEVALAA